MPKSDVPSSLTHRRLVQVDSLQPDPFLFERIGPAAVDGLVEQLYNRLEADAELRPMFVRDLAEERNKQNAFWREWLGGPTEYTRGYAYSGLVARHAHIHITAQSSARWLQHFEAALRSVVSDDDAATCILDPVRAFAQALINEQRPAPRASALRCTRVRPYRTLRALAERGDTPGMTSAMTAQPGLLADAMEMAEVLLAAVLKRRYEAVDALLKAGVSPNGPAHYKEGCIFQSLMLSPLCAALLKEDQAVADLLREYGAAYDVFTAAYLGDEAYVATTMDTEPHLLHCSDPATDVLEMTPLLHAVCGGHDRVVALLLNRGATVGRNSGAMIRHAANRNRTGLVRRLLTAGAEAAYIGPGTWTQDEELADLLLQHGADVNTPCGEWIWRACTGNNSQRDDPTLVFALLRCGADITMRLRGATALHYAAKAGFLGVARALLEHGADPNAPNPEGMTPLLYALKAGKRADVPAMCRTLVAGGARPTQEDFKGCSALQAAQRLKRDDRNAIVAALLQKP